MDVSHQSDCSLNRKCDQYHSLPHIQSQREHDEVWFNICTSGANLQLCLYKM